MVDLNPLHYVNKFNHMFGDSIASGLEFLGISDPAVDPDGVREIAKKWRDLASGLDDAADDAERALVGVVWEGKTAKAFHKRAKGTRKNAADMADSLREGAKALDKFADQAHELLSEIGVMLAEIAEYELAGLALDILTAGASSVAASLMAGERAVKVVALVARIEEEGTALGAAVRTVMEAIRGLERALKALKDIKAIASMSKMAVEGAKFSAFATALEDPGAFKDPEKLAGILTEGAVMGVGFGVLGKALGKGLKSLKPSELAKLSKTLKLGGSDLSRLKLRPAEAEKLEAGIRAAEKECKLDPIDVATGDMLLPQTDVELPGVLPLILQRTHISSYRWGGWFGPSWASTLDQRLQAADDGITYATADGARLTYPLLAPDANEPAYPDNGARLPLTWDTETDGALRLSDPTSGLAYVFHTPQLVDDGDAVDLCLQAIVDRNGQRITVQYADDGTPTGVTHSGGYRIALDRHPTLPRISSLRLLDPERPNGRGTILLSYDYDDQGHLAEVTNSSALPARFTYDGAGRITSWTDRTDTSYEYLYDEWGRVVRTEGSDGFLSGSLAYDGLTRTTTVTNSLGHTTRYEHNDAFRLIRETDPLGHSTSQEWAAAHQLTAVTDALGNTTRFRYDETGRTTSVIRPDGSETRAEYNDLGLPTTVTGPDGVVFRYAYDERGNRTAITDALGATTHFSYNGSGHLSSITDPLGHRTRFRCDPVGLPLAVVDPLGAETHYERDAFGRPVTLTGPLGNVTHFAWTVEGKPARRTAPDGSVESWTYDGEGNCTSHTDSMGAVHRFEYTHFDLLSARTGPDGARHTFTHDSELRLTKVTNPQGLSWSYQHDPAGRLISETDFDNRVVSYTHDQAGRLTTRTNPFGQTLRFERDVLGQITRQTDEVKATAFTYSAVGELTKAVTPDATLVRDHDAAGRLLSETVNGRTVRYDYDAMGRRTLRTTPTGLTSTWRYDAAGSCVERTSADRTIGFDRDAAGREVNRHVGAFLTLANTFDDLGRLTAQSVTDRTTGKSLQRRVYGYRADGHLTAIDDQLSGTSRFELDTTGRVTTVHARGWTERYAYDEAGNQTDASWPATQPGHEATGPRDYVGTRLVRAGNVRYEHDAAGRITLRQKTRLSRKPDTWRYTWDAEDRLVSVITPDGTCWQYRYDPLGRRIAKQRLAADGETIAEQTHFTWDGDTLCEQTTHAAELPNPVTVTWDHEGLHPIAQTERGTALEAPQEEIDSRFFAIVTDLVGTPTELIGETGGIAWRARSTLWGTTSWGVGSTAYTPLRFPGQYHDPETGLHYNYFRHYDPETARYLTPDPLGLAPAPNPVTYVTNPYSWSDPLGLAPCKTGSPDPYLGTKEASQLLRDAGVPRAFRVQVMQSFEEGTISVRRAGSSDYGMRFYDNENAWARGRYLTTQWPATREEIAVKAGWNQFSYLKQWKIRPGAPIIEGRVAPQGVGYPGGGKQTYVLDPDRDLLEP
ncbi:DUF6531 domain-containing protein [Streptomyces sp. NBC_00554]|uniref:DUF6531 domain-containing protein n=1 Tax=Streptomyces sp. NBC_00554 TaxID=2903661 RepID=UPI00352F9388|nr:DUF6531 domain-containing protein [Streptomyces sp. NBC_00554]